MKSIIQTCSILLAFTTLLACADDQAPTTDGFRVMSWNIATNAFDARPQKFQSLLGWADPDIVLLDEVDPRADVELFRSALAKLQPDNNTPWTVSVGVSGGRQLCIIASRAEQETVPEFSTHLSYPEADKQYILEHMSEKTRANPDYSMEGGIPVNAAIVIANGKRLLAVSADLQCCGGGPDSWQEYRRRVETRAIRARIRQVLERTSVDAVIIAGDFNLVNGTTPLTILTGPYDLPHAGLVAAELYQPDGVTSWTWDGRGTPFNSNTLDFQLYTPQALELRSGLILDTENLAAEVLEQYGLKSDTANTSSDHRPLLAEYGWR